MANVIYQYICEETVHVCFPNIKFSYVAIHIFAARLQPRETVFSILHLSRSKLGWSWLHDDLDSDKSQVNSIPIERVSLSFKKDKNESTPTDYSIILNY